MIILYCIISSVFIAGLLVLFRFVPGLRSQRARNLMLFFVALAAFLVHTSELWLAVPLGVVAFSEVSLGGIFILSPCSASMWGMLVIGFMAVRGWGNVFGHYLAVGVAYIGFVGAFSTVYLSTIFGTDVNFFADWYMTANLISHSLLLLGCLYIVMADFIKIKVSNVFPVFLLGAVYHMIGGINILFFWAVGTDFVAVNPMYIFAPFGGVWLFYGYVLWAVATVFTLIVAIIYEFAAVKPQDRFYKNWTKDYWLKQ